MGVNLNGHAILAERSAIHYLTTVLNALLTELFGQSVVLSKGGITGVNAVLHELIEVESGTVEDIDTTGSDFAVNSGEFSVDDVVPHQQRILPSPIPGRVESTGFKGIENREDTVNVEIAVFATDRIQTCLKSEGTGLLCVLLEIAGPRILFETARIEFNLRAGEPVLLCLEFEELFTVHHCSSTSPNAGTTG